MPAAKLAPLLAAASLLTTAGILLALTASPGDGGLSARAIVVYALEGAGVAISIVVAMTRRGNRRHRV